VAPKTVSRHPAAARCTRWRDSGPIRGGKCTRGEARLLHIALIEPRIPPNTGNIARLCAATETSLHLIEPLGFQLGDAELKRAGLDYWDDVDLWIHPGWRDFREAMVRSRCLYFSARAKRPLEAARFLPNSVLVFGNETDGMPDRILDKHPEECFTIPMRSGKVRSLNLATAVGIVLYEALRQLGSADAAAAAAALVEDDGEARPAKRGSRSRKR
jgi:tRNA (cytidine/uridine-2'-O-)-methyltransferase